MTNETTDQEIKKKVQLVEKEIPGELEKIIMKELRQVQPLKTSAVPDSHRRLFRRPLAAAASVFLGVLLLVATLSFLFRQKTTIQEIHEEESVMIDAAWLEGRPTETFIITQKDPDLTIVWIEKKP